MKSIYATKKLQSTELYQELQHNLKDYFAVSLSKEQKQKEYLSRIDLCNISTGELFKLDYDFELEYKKYTKLIEQKVSSIEHIAKELEYISVFMTFTLPSRFHPFQSIQRGDKRLYVSLNERFEFDTITEAITKGYSFLNELIRTFYKRVKNYVGDEFFYVKVYEPHSTTIPHVHYLVFFPCEHLDAVKATYKRVVALYELNQSDFEEPKFRENITFASRYLLKYITKNLQDGQDYFCIRAMDGWKRTHKIRVITSSDIGLSQFLYKKIYYSLTPDIKSKIDLVIKELGVPYYLYLQNNTYIKKYVTHIESKITKTVKSTQGSQKALFTIKIKSNRIRAPDGKIFYRITDLSIKHKRKLLYKKANLVKIQTH